MEFTYFMPTQLFVGDIHKYSDEFNGFGKKALIITGKSSAEKNGSLQDVTSILNNLGVGLTVFNGITENPDLKCVELATAIGIREGVDFVIGIGGGSPMDASKAVSLLIKNLGVRAVELYKKINLEHLPLLLIPTTAGSGSETTPFSILTVHEKETKISIAVPVFAHKAFINAAYTHSLPNAVTLSTAIDAYTHLVEGYLTVKANFLSDKIAESGFAAFGECVNNLKNTDFTPDIREKLMLISSLGGMVISHAKTTLPHQMSYALTYFKNIAHGFACGMTLYEYLLFHPNKAKVENIIHMTGFKHIDELGLFLNDIINVNFEISQHELKVYSNSLAENTDKLKNHPGPISVGDLIRIYERSLYKYTNHCL